MCLIVSSALSVNKISILFKKKKMINLKPNSNKPIQIWKKTGSCIRLARHFAELISDIFWSIDGGHNPRYGIWNHRACLLCQRVISSEFTQRQKTMKLKTKHALTPNTNERKWRQPLFQLYLITKSRARYRRELALPTSSIAVDLWKMMLRMMFRTFFL